MVVEFMAVNYLAVLVSSIVAFIIGYLWFSPYLFGNLWMKLSGIDSNKKDKPVKKKSMTGSLIGGFVSLLVMMYVLAYFISYAGAKTWVDGACIGALVWLGFFATTMLGMVLWEGKPFKLYLLSVLHYLVVLVIAGVILAVWA